MEWKFVKQKLGRMGFGDGWRGWMDKGMHQIHLLSSLGRWVLFSSLKSIMSLLQYDPLSSLFIVSSKSHGNSGEVEILMCDVMVSASLISVCR